MKKVFTVLLIVISSVAFAQKQQIAKQNYSKIKQNSCIKGEGYKLLLKEVVTDSRCPEGVTCVWAGEVSVIVSVYKDSEFVEDKKLVFSTNNNTANLNWIIPYLDESHSRINSLTIAPHPNVGKVIKPKDYYLEIGYLQYN